MVDICNMSNFPTLRYFNQYEIPDHGPAGYEYQYTRCLLISAEATVSSARNVLTFTPAMADQFHSGQYPGVPRPANWEDVIFDSYPTSEFAGFLPPSPFDFKLWHKSRIAIRLQGDFWRFSTDLAPITTKHQYGTQYFNMLLHRKEGASLISLTLDQWRAESPVQPCRCISFFTGEPCRDSALPGGSPKVVHGFSLNVEIPRYDTSGTLQNLLAITIDPDIENKGGSG